MAFRGLTETGKEFIRQVIIRITNEQGDTALIKGKNSYNLPLSDVSNTSVTWIAHLTDFNGRPIFNNIQFGEYLIESFNKNAEIYGIDTNIIAAQAFQESIYKCWNYAPPHSTASGIGQFLMAATYDAIYTFKFTSPDEKAKLTLNMEDPDQKASWIGVLTKYTANERAKQFRNHSILHQNITDNPDIMIKLQCALMGMIGERNNNLASNSLFAYNRGSSYKSDTYSGIINLVSEKKGNTYIDEGVKYVEKIFGYLGDKDNTKVTLPSVVNGLWFGYDNIDFGFDEFNANVASSNTDTSSRNISNLQNELKLAYLSAKNTFEIKYAGQYSIGVSSVHRSVSVQKELFSKGRNNRGEVVNKSEVITYLDGVKKKSKHNYLNAKGVDFFVLNEITRIVEWNNIPLFTEFAELVKNQSSSISWGGDWEKFKDYPHLQIA